MFCICTVLPPNGLQGSMEEQLLLPKKCPFGLAKIKSHMFGYLQQKLLGRL
jgi:hypothetical protein